MYKQKLSWREKSNSDYSRDGNAVYCGDYVFLRDPQEKPGQAIQLTADDSITTENQYAGEP
ncbi:hypothetical protein ACFL5Z_00705 [Planctomycetota bacterium]